MCLYHLSLSDPQPPCAIDYLLATAMASDIPDLSHLTAEERQIIESVMMRQKQEEERELEIMRWVSPPSLVTSFSKPTSIPRHDAGVSLIDFVNNSAK